MGLETSKTALRVKRKKSK